MRYVYCIIIAFLLTIRGFAQSYGLLFNSHEVVQEKRTCLDLSPGDSLCFKKHFEVCFDIGFLPARDIYFGYVVRLVMDNNQNIDLIYNQPSSSFKVIIGENFSGISFIVDSVELHKAWTHFSLQCDLENHILVFLVNGKETGRTTIPAGGNCFRCLWGANDYQKFKTRDIPPMKIKDIKILENGTLTYYWPLDETAGNNCTDRVGRHMAAVKNPVWLKPQYQQWEEVGSFTINGFAGVAFDAKHDKLYVTGSDSIGIYSLRNNQPGMDWLPCKHQALLIGHQTVYDTLHDRLCDLYFDRRMVSTFNFAQHQWDTVLGHAPITEYWHANKFISPIDSSLYMIGGYGQLRYKNAVHRYRFATRSWDSIKVSGDHYTPRYLAALGLAPGNEAAYIVGGYGSQTGDQMLDPRNYYDLFRYDIRAGAFKRLYSLKAQNTPFAFANSLVVCEKKGTWYGLIYPNDSYNSQLQLIEGTLTDSVYQPAGNTIPYSFHDIQSFCDLYYSPQSNRLLVVTLLCSREDAAQPNTQVKIYSINFPPEAPGLAAGALPLETNGHGFLYAILAVTLGAAILAVVLKRRQLKQQPVASTPALPMVEEQPVATTAHVPHEVGHAPMPMEKEHRSAVHLFGQFQVFDKEGNDITRLFTPLLKELFLIILIHTVRNGRGISSEGLNEILWRDKSEKDAKNNRSVNLAKLKTILEKIGNGVINKEGGYWQFAIPDNDIFVDYRQYVHLQQEAAADPALTYIHPLADIIRLGAFLSQTEYDWLDDIKSEVSNTVIDLCLRYIKERDLAKDPEFIVELTTYIFYFDPLNEDALTYKCKCLILLKRHALASNTYQKFVKEYKDIYGTDFNKSFQEAIA